MKFGTDLSGDFRTDRRLAGPGLFYGRYDLITGGILQHIITGPKLESGEDQFVFFVHGQDHDAGFRIHGEDLPGGPDTGIFGFHLDIHKNDVRLVLSGCFTGLLSGTDISDYADFLILTQDVNISFSNGFHIFCDEYFNFFLHDACLLSLELIPGGSSEEAG